MIKSNKICNNVHNNKPDKFDMIEFTNATSHPPAMVIIGPHTSPTLLTMLTSVRLYIYI